MVMFAGQHSPSDAVMLLARSMTDVRAKDSHKSALTIMYFAKQSPNTLKFCHLGLLAVEVSLTNAKIWQIVRASQANGGEDQLVYQLTIFEFWYSPKVHACTSATGLRKKTSTTWRAPSMALGEREKSQTPPNSTRAVSTHYAGLKTRRNISIYSQIPGPRLTIPKSMILSPERP